MNTIIYTKFLDGLTLVNIDKVHADGILLRSGEDITFEYLRPGKVIWRELKCTHKWYKKRFGGKKVGDKKGDHDGVTETAAAARGGV